MVLFVGLRILDFGNLSKFEVLLMFLILIDIVVGFFLLRIDMLYIIMVSNYVIIIKFFLEKIFGLIWEDYLLVGSIYFFWKVYDYWLITLIDYI